MFCLILCFRSSDKKKQWLYCDSELWTKKTGFTVFSELGTKKTLVLLGFVVCSELGTKTKQWFYCVF